MRTVETGEESGALALSAIAIKGSEDWDSERRQIFRDGWLAGRDWARNQEMLAQVEEVRQAALTEQALEQDGLLVVAADKSEPGREDIWLLRESWNADGSACISIVASIKPWCQEWAAYWAAQSATMTDDERLEATKKSGNKMRYEVAAAMFPFVEKRYDVRWRR